MSTITPYLPRLLALLGVWLLAVVTPGPDFVVTTRYAVAHSRRDGVQVGLGVACGIAIWVTLSLAGLGFAMAYLSGPLTILRLLGALFLIWLGGHALWAAVRRGRSTGAMVGAAIHGREGGRAGGAAGGVGKRLPSWLAGFLTNIGNAKALAFFTSIFALLLPASPPLWLDGAILVGMVGISAGWFTIVALLFSLEPVARLYHRAQRWIDGVTGGVFVALGVELAVNR